MTVMLNVAKAHGFMYAFREDIRAMNTPDRVEAITERLDAFDRLKKPAKPVLAALGGEIKESLSLDQMLTRFKQLASSKWADLDDDAKRKKWNRYAEPIADFKRTMGDKDVLKITSSDAANYAIELGKRIEAGNLKSETAKKKILFLNAMVQRVFNADFPNRSSPFENAVIDHDGDGETRKPFSEADIIALNKKIAESDANDELKAICKVLELTGCHAKEIALLSASDIHLNVPVPYIRIGVNENRKKLKTGGARHRDIPLLPEAIEVFKRYPNGFPRYCYAGGPNNFTQSANKLIQSAITDRTTYSWRHRMVDLLRNHKGVKDDMLKAIVGHNGGQTADYGEGFDLENKLEALVSSQERAAFLRKKNNLTTA